MEIKPIARRHHYLPQAYLADFTSVGSKNGQFHVFDVQTRHSFRTTPLNVAIERDFNRLDVKDRAPDAIEKVLASFEAQATPAIQRVIQSQASPCDDDHNLLVLFLG